MVGRVIHQCPFSPAKDAPTLDMFGFCYTKHFQNTSFVTRRIFQTLKRDVALRENIEADLTTD